MNLLLMSYDNIRYAVDMTYISRIINMERTPAAVDLCLWDPEHPVPSPAGVMLKNGLVLPASEVEEMLSYDGGAAVPNPFLRGCMKNSNIEGFIMNKNRIYGKLNAIFLKMASIEEKKE
jgi:hypothetical protein